MKQNLKLRREGLKRGHEEEEEEPEESKERSTRIAGVAAAA